MLIAAPSRRRFMQGATALPLFGATSVFGADKPSAVIGRVLAMSDLHSAYERSAQLLAALRAEVRSHPVPHLIAIDGDIFEHGNVVSVRSEGAIDWAFLAALPAIAPTVVNLGNHDNDLTPDLHEVVARMRGLGSPSSATSSTREPVSPMRRRRLNWPSAIDGCASSASARTR